MAVKPMMDRAALVKCLGQIEEAAKETLRLNATAFVIYVTAGAWDRAAWSLQVARSALHAIEQCGQPHWRAWRARYDEETAGVLEEVTSGAGFADEDEKYLKARAQRMYREMQTAWRMFAEEGVHLGPHIFEKLLALDPDKREKAVNSFSPLPEHVKDGLPCLCDDPVIPDDWSRSFVCTGCLTRFDSRQPIGKKDGAIVMRERKLVRQ